MEIVKVVVGSSSSGVGETGSEERAMSESTAVVSSSSSGARIRRGGEGGASKRTPETGEKASTAGQGA